MLQLISSSLQCHMILARVQSWNSFFVMIWMVQYASSLTDVFKALISFRRLIYILLIKWYLQLSFSYSITQIFYVLSYTFRENSDCIGMDHKFSFFLSHFSLFANERVSRIKKYVNIQYGAQLCVSTVTIAPIMAVAGSLHGASWLPWQLLWFWCFKSS